MCPADSRRQTKYVGRGSDVEWREYTTTAKTTWFSEVTSIRSDTDSCTANEITLSSFGARWRTSNVIKTCFFPLAFTLFDNDDDMS